MGGYKAVSINNREIRAIDHSFSWSFDNYTDREFFISKQGECRTHIMVCESDLIRNMQEKKSPAKKGGNYILSLLRGYFLDFVKPNKHRVNLLIGLNEISLLPTDK